MCEIAENPWGKSSGGYAAAELSGRTSGVNTVENSKNSKNSKSPL